MVRIHTLHLPCVSSNALMFVSFPYKRNGIFFSSAVNYLHSYNNQINARALIGQSAVGYCAGKHTEKSRNYDELLYKSNRLQVSMVYLSNRPQVSMGYLQVNALGE